MEIREMTMADVEERKAAIKELIANPDADLDALTAEVEELNKRSAEIKAEAETRQAVIEDVIENGETIKTFEEEKPIMEERKVFGIDTVEYRNAFMANLVGQANEEQRSILADNTAYGDGLSLPVSLDTAIWDQVTMAHPILADITRVNAGMPMKVTKMSPAAISKKKDSAASTEQTFTTAEVTLVGADYHTYVAISYAEAKMSQGAMEKFLVSEVASAIGEAMAKDVFARILTDAAANSVTSTSDYFADIKTALGKASQATRPVIYAPAADYYEIVGAIKSGSPFNIGNVLGCEVKLDSAATKVTVVDPSVFVLDVVQDTIIESERDAKNAQIIIGGYMRAEGCLRKTNAAAFIA